MANLGFLRQQGGEVSCLYDTLQELQEFRTKTTISVISDLLKSMGKFFSGIFPLKHLQISKTSQNPLGKLLHSLKGLCSGIF